MLTACIKIKENEHTLVYSHTSHCSVSSLFLWWPVPYKCHHFDLPQHWHSSRLVGTSNGNRSSVPAVGVWKVGSVKGERKRMKIRKRSQVLYIWTSGEYNSLNTFRKAVSLFWKQVQQQTKNKKAHLSPLHAVATTREADVLLAHRMLFNSIL